MAAVGLQKLEHPLVGRSWGALERVTDRMRKVIVADGDRIGVAQRHRRNFGRRPGPDAGKRTHPLIGAGDVHRDDFLQAVCAPRGTNDDLRPPSFDAETMEAPVGRPRKHLRRRRKRQGRRAGRRLAKGVDQMPVRVDRLLCRHLLQDHRRDDSFEDGAGSRQADAADLVVQPLDERMRGREACVIVGLTAKLGRVRDSPVRARAPSTHLHRTATLLQLNGRWAIRGARRPPGGPVVMAQRRS